MITAFRSTGYEPKEYLIYQNPSKLGQSLFIVPENHKRNADSRKSLTQIGGFLIDARMPTDRLPLALLHSLRKIQTNSRTQLVVAEPIFAPDNSDTRHLHPYICVKPDYEQIIGSKVELTQTASNLESQFKINSIAGLNVALNPTMLDWHHPSGRYIAREEVRYDLTIHSVINTMYDFEEGEMGMKHIAARYLPKAIMGSITLVAHKTKGFQAPLETTVQFFE